MTTSTLNPKSFQASNIHWMDTCADMGRSGDLLALKHYLGRESMRAVQEYNRALGANDRTARALSHQELQVSVPALRRLNVLLQTSPLHTAKARKRLSLFLLGYVAQSNLFPLPGKNDDSSLQELANVSMKGRTPMHRHVALNILRDNATLFAPCPAWVEPLVCAPIFMTAEVGAGIEDVMNKATATKRLRRKILSAGILTADEEMLLVKVL